MEGEITTELTLSTVSRKRKVNGDESFWPLTSGEEVCKLPGRVKKGRGGRFEGKVQIVLSGQSWRTLIVCLTSAIDNLLPMLWETDANQWERLDIPCWSW